MSSGVGSLDVWLAQVHDFNQGKNSSKRICTNYVNHWLNMSELVKLPIDIHGAKCIAYVAADAMEGEWDEITLDPYQIFFQDIALPHWKQAVESYFLKKSNIKKL